MSTKYFKKAISMLLTLVLSLSMMHGSLAALGGPAKKDPLPVSEQVANILASFLPAQAFNTMALNNRDRPVEIISLRSETGKHFRLGDGRNIAIHFIERLHYLDEYGQWRDIDNTIIPVRNESFPYRNKANDHHFYFTDNREGSGIRWEYEEYWLEMELASSQPAKAVVSENTVFYPGVFPNIGLKYTVLNNGLKEGLVFYNPPETHEFFFSISTQGLELKENGGIIEIYSSATNEYISSLMAPFLVDNAGEINQEIRQTLLPTDSGYLIVYTIENTDWLEHEDRIYPVELDPSLFFSLDEDTYAQQRYASILAYNQEYLYVGYDDGGVSGNGTYYKQRTRTFLRFELPEDLTPYVDVQEAYMGLYRNTAWSSTSRTANLHRVTSNVPMRKLTWNNMPSIASTPVDSVTISGTTRKTYEWEVTNLVRGWLDGSIPNYGVCVKFANESLQGEAFASRNHNNLTPPRHAPYLVVVYEDPGPVSPSIDITSPAEGDYVRGTIALKANAEHISGIKKVEFDVAGRTLTDNSAPYSVQWDSTGVADGSYTVLAIATDNVGNTASDSVNIVVDNTPPETKVDSPKADARVGGTVSISGTASDARSGLAGIDLYVNGRLKKTFTSSPFTYAWDTRTLEDGQAEIRITTRDRAGNSSTEIIPVTVINQSQEVSILNPHPDSFVSGQLQVEVSATGAVTLVELLVNGESAGQTTAEPFRFSLDTTTLPDGEYTLTACAYGYAGDPVVSEPIRVIVSNSQPALEVLQPQQGDSLTGSVDIVYAADSNTGIDRVDADYTNLATGMTGHIFTGGKAEAVFSWDISRLIDGPYQLKFRAYDRAGNVTEVKRNVLVENIPPTSGLFEHHTYANMTFANHSVKVNVATGNLLLQAEETQTTGGVLRGVSLRTYNHHSGWLSLNGRGNNLNYAFMYDAGDGAINLIDFSGAKLRFVSDGKGGYKSPAGVRGKLIRQAGGTFRYWDSQQQMDYIFNSSGRLEKIRDLNGNSITYIYDSQGHLIRIQSPTGQQITFRYNPEGLVRQVVDNAGRMITYNYDNQMRLTTVIDALNGTIELGYDTDGRVNSLTDKAGETLSIAYQGNRVSCITSPAGDTNSFDYDPQNRQTTHINPLGAVTRYSYDQHGRVTEKKEYVDSPGAMSALSIQASASEEPYITRYVFDNEHNLTGVTDPAGREETYVYDSQGNLVSFTDAAGRTTTMEYNDLNQVTAIKDSADLITALEYDEQGNLLSMKDPAGGIYEFAYNEAGNLMQKIDPLGRISEYLYDEYGHLTRYIDPGEGLHDYIYDEMGNLLQYTDPAGQSTTFEYDLLNRVTRTTDPEGGTTWYSYDDSQRELTLTDPLGKTTSYKLNYQNQVAQMVDAAGNATVYDYDGTGNLVEFYTAEGIQAKFVFDPLGRLLQHIDGEGNTSGFGWDRASNLVQTVDPTGAVHNYDYDQLGRLTAVTDPLGSRYEYQYDSADNLAVITDPLGNTTQFKYDPLGQLTQLTTPQGESHNYEYDAGGRLTKITSADGLVVEYRYDNLDRVIRESNSIGEERHYIYDAAGNIIAVTNELNQIWTFEYDALGRIISMTDPGGNRNSYIYDAAGRIISISTQGQGTWHYEYDDLGRLLKEIDPSGHTTQYEYDASGNLVAVTSPTGARTQYVYDSLGQLVELIDPLGNKYTYKYDQAGNLVYSQDPLGNVYCYRYNARGWLIEVTDPMDGVTTIDYDIVGNPVKITDAAGSEVQYTYDAYGNLIQETDPLGQAVSYLYDSHGRIEQQTDPRGIKISYAYDEAGRLTAKTTPEDTKSFSYLEQQLLIQESRGETIYSYNHNRHLTAKVHPLAGELTYNYQDGNLASRGLGSFQTAFSYLENGGLDSVITPGGTMTFIKDNAGRLIGRDYTSGWSSAYKIGPTSLLEELSLTDNIGQIKEQISYQRDALGRIISEQGFSGETAYEYDPLGRLVKVTYPDERSEEYTYDAAGNLLEIKTASGEVIATFQYDAANQLTKADYPHYPPGLLHKANPRARANADAKADRDNQPNPGQGRNNEPEDRINSNAPGNDKNPPGQAKKTPDKDGKDKESPGNSANAPGHDPNGPGNSENAPGHNKDGPGNSPNTPGPGQKLEFEYDQAGNLVSILSALFNTHYSYDSENHLISATINGNHEAVYTYNALGLRDSKTTQRGTVYYVYDGMNLIAELDEDGEIIAYYSHDLDGKLVSITYGDETYFYHFNHRGDTLYLTDHEGNIAASYTYDAWGNIMGKEGDLANKNPYRYKGRHGYYYDADTDLYLLNSRWYNPELKRFMTRDNQQGEAADPVSLNRYVYCGNDPVNYVDPIGTYRVTVSINGGGSPKPQVPEPPKPPQKPTLSSPTPPIAPTSGIKQSSSSTVISQTVKTSQPTESAPQAPAQPTVIQNLIKGTYFGTQYGEENTDWYVQRIVEMEHDAAWYELVPYYVGAGFSVLWTPDTWWMTAGTLIGGLAVAKVAAGATIAKVAGGIKTAFAIISGWLGCGGTDTASGQLHHVLSNKIMAALNSHPVLRGVFNRCDYLVRALTANAHKGYQIWHRLYDAKVVQWLLDNPNATPAKFIDFLNQFYRDPEMIERFGRFIIKIMR